MYYEELELESNVPEIFKNKPPWLRCIIATSCLILITIASIAIGVFIGYTYCYYEHRNGNIQAESAYNSSANTKDFTNGAEYQDSKDRTINTALQTHPMIAKILKVVHNTLIEAISVENNNTNQISKKEMVKLPM